MLRYFIQKVSPGRFIRPRMVICVPSGITPVEQRAVQEAAISAGAKKPVYIIEEPMAAAIGAGLPVQEASGSMIVDIGGGTTEVAMISLGGVVTGQSIRMGGDRMDEDIIAYLKKEHSLTIGGRTAEEVKMVLGSAWAGSEDRYAEVRGQDMVTGLPKTVVTSTSEIREAISEVVRSIADAVKVTLDGDSPRAGCRHHGGGDRSGRRRGPAERPAPPARGRDGDAGPVGAQSPPRGGHRLGPVAGGVLTR